MADFDAPELHSPEGRAAKQALERIAMGRRVECIARRGRNGRVRSYDRVIAVCHLNAVPLGDRMRSAGVGHGGR